MINKHIIVGYIGQDTDVRAPVTMLAANMSIATTDKWLDKDGQKKEETEWHRVSCFGALAEIVQKYIKKGSLVYVEGKSKTSAWTDKVSGVEKSNKVIVASTIRFLGSSGGGKSQGVSNPVNSGNNAHNNADMDDLIPF